MSALTRGKCMSCGRIVALRNGGLAREHRPADARPGSRVCPGSGLAAATRFGVKLPPKTKKKRSRR